MLILLPAFQHREPQQCKTIHSAYRSLGILVVKCLIGIVDWSKH